MIQILAVEIEPLFLASRSPIEERQLFFVEQSPGIMHHLVHPPSSRREVGFNDEVFVDELTD